MKISLIAALAKNNVIGKENDLVWSLPDDFKRFKSITSGHLIAMGRKTFESLGKPLPNRIHLVVTRSRDFTVPSGHHVFPSVEKVLEYCHAHHSKLLYVIGGGEIYRQILPLADELLLTEVEAEPEGDTYFPEFDRNDWTIVSKEYHPEDKHHQYAFTYVDYVRKKN